MFCTKLKELKISGECPFSGSAIRNDEPGDLEQRSGDAADLLPVFEDVHGGKGEAPPRQRARGKVNLHTLGESIRKLACPEVSLKNNINKTCKTRISIQSRYSDLPSFIKGIKR